MRREGKRQTTGTAFVLDRQNSSLLGQGMQGGTALHCLGTSHPAHSNTLLGTSVPNRCSMQARSAAPVCLSGGGTHIHSGVKGRDDWIAPRRRRVGSRHDAHRDLCDEQNGARGQCELAMRKVGKREKWPLYRREVNEPSAGVTIWKVHSTRKQDARQGPDQALNGAIPHYRDHKFQASIPSTHPCGHLVLTLLD